MKKLSLVLLCLAALISLGAAENKIIAQWDFTSADPLNNGTYPLILRGDAKIENGMLISEGDSVSKPYGAKMKNNPREITPANAFSLTVEFMFDPAMKRQNKSAGYLWDSKYVALPGDPKSKQHRGFFLAHKISGDNSSFTAAFGFGNVSAQVNSNSIKLEPKVKHTVKLSFTATGRVSFECNGKNLGTRPVPPGPLAHSMYSPSIGDRHSSNNATLGGGIYKVTLKEEDFTPVEIMADSYFRKVFERGEKNIAVHATLSNYTKAPITGITVKAETMNRALPDQKLAPLAPGEIAKFSWKIDEWLMHGDYELKCSAVDAAGKVISSTVIPYTIVPAYGDFMPVLLWGGGTIDEVKKAGFTHMSASIYPISGDFKETSIPNINAALDNNLKNGIYSYTSVYPKYRFLTSKRYLIVDAEGKQRSGLEASHPEVRKEFARVMEQTAKAMADHPGWDSTLINSEIRGTASPSFTGFQQENFKKYAGYDIPDDIKSATPVTYAAIPGFPWNRIMDPKDKHLVYYNWFRKTGDGWNDLQTLISDSLHKYVKHHHFTFHDPAVRVLPQWGSGGNVDVISQWTYTYPDAIKIGQATDELLAMADGNPEQRVMKMTQAIWYRSATAPMNKKVDNYPEWYKTEKKAKFISIAPDFVREAIWSKVSRKIDGIMYHGSGSLLYKTDHGYRYTNSESKKVLADTVNRVIKPFGPMLKKIPERMPEVAILESATGWLYATRHMTGGWSGNWAGDLHLALQWANIQPSIIYEEHLLTNLKLDGIKVIIMPGAEVLTEPVLAKLQELQSKGVIIIGDEYTTPALMVDFRLKSLKRKTSDPKGSKEMFQKLGMEIAEMLKPYYKSQIAASNNDLVVRRRGNDSADYVFVLNDKRTFGDYVGQWGMVMEKGLPNSGTVTVSHPVKAAYDLMKHEKIKTSGKDSTTFNVDLGPGDGTIVLLLDQEISRISINAPEKTVSRSEAYSITIKVQDKKRNNIKAYIPLEVKLTDSEGKALPGSGFYSTVDGILTINETAASNMSAGKVKIQVKCLASGITETETFNVK